MPRLEQQSESKVRTRYCPRRFQGVAAMMIWSCPRNHPELGAVSRAWQKGGTGTELRCRRPGLATIPHSVAALAPSRLYSRSSLSGRGAPVRQGSTGWSVRERATFLTDDAHVAEVARCRCHVLSRVLRIDCPAYLNAWHSTVGKRVRKLGRQDFPS